MTRSPCGLFGTARDVSDLLTARERIAAAIPRARCAALLVADAPATILLVEDNRARARGPHMLCGME